VTAADPDQRSYVDAAAPPLCLGDGCHAVETVDPDGGRSYWILVPNGRCGVPVSTPAHEQLGPLPWPVRARVNMHRCGRPTLSGKPCRTPVARRGLTCAHHRSTARAS